MPTSIGQFNSDLQKILDARHHDPFAVLGKHLLGESEVVRVFVPAAKKVTILLGNLPMARASNKTDLFEWQGKVGTDWLHAPTSIYEVHLGSWRRDDDGEIRPFSLRGWCFTIGSFTKPRRFLITNYQLPINKVTKKP
ncbi:MAG: hypothetical protein DRR08_05925 [Candidatus Parabeggiatoa sp. nov. 2]|nr:MAG: hypothetical protein B6247_09485 [Beggiatoa sp. 4572_84]RKZ62515.1 MAG: hypothetical protein DRR08_05925 [Gammaproteobacteria bacterium]